MEIELKDILAFAKSLDGQIQARADKIVAEKPQDPYQSEKVDLLSLGLSKAQGTFKPIPFDRENPYLGLGYTELANILSIIRKPLSENELSLSQSLKINPDSTITLHTVLRHSSGQWIESRVRIIPKKNDLKAFESALNAHKRLSILSLLNIAVTGDPVDDDAEIAMADSRDIVARGSSNKYDPREQSFERITREQLQQFENIFKAFPEVGQTLLDHYGLSSLADLPKSKFEFAINRAREIADLRNNGPRKIVN